MLVSYVLPFKFVGGCSLPTSSKKAAPSDSTNSNFGWLLVKLESLAGWFVCLERGALQRTPGI